MKFCPTERIDGDKITLGLPELSSPEIEPEPQPARSWTLPAIVSFVAATVVAWGVYALVEWLEKRGVGK